MALRDGSMWSSTPTGSEDRGASRLAAVRREASSLGVIGRYGVLRGICCWLDQTAAWDVRLQLLHRSSAITVEITVVTAFA